MNFSETIQWVDVVKPFNTDYNVAERTELVFLNPHGFMVGDYLTETSSGGTGVVYEVPSTTRLYLARQDTTDFPYMGSVTDGTTESTYTERHTEHGINNQVIQDLVDRTAYNRKDIQDAESEIGSIQNNITNIEGDITNIEGNVTNLGDEITNVGGNIPDLSYVLTESSMTLEKNRTTIANLNGSDDITLTMPSDAQNGDWVEVMHGGTNVLGGSVYLSGGGFSFSGAYSTIELDVVFWFVRITLNGTWHFTY